MPSSPLTPILGPLFSLLRSRKFMAALMTLAIDLLVAYLPALEPVRAELLVVLTLVGSTLVAAIAYEDGQKAQAGVNGFFDVYTDEESSPPTE